MKPDTITCTRKIEIDAGHRIPNHHSKCRHIHGHRYVIEATVRGILIMDGPSEGMIIDFGFLKDYMMTVIHNRCDHTLILCKWDPLLPTLEPDENYKSHGSTEWEVRETKYTRVYVIKDVPTAENLAKHWFHQLNEQIRSGPEPATLEKLRVYETPNCWADHYRQLP